jgi:hypothetical protein
MQLKQGLSALKSKRFDSLTDETAFYWRECRQSSACLQQRSTVAMHTACDSGMLTGPVPLCRSHTVRGRVVAETSLCATVAGAS